MNILKNINKWTHTHTALTVAIVAVAGYFAYKKYYKKSPSSGTTAFTGGSDSYFK